MRDNLADLRVVISVSETHHCQVLLGLSLRVLRRLFIQLFQLIQNQLHKSQSHLTLDNIRTIEAVETVSTHDPSLLAENAASLPLLTVVAKVFDQFVLDLNYQIIDEIELVSFGLGMKVVVSQLYLLRHAHIELYL